MSLVTRKPVFGVRDQGRLKPVCAPTEARYRLEISDIETEVIILSRQRKALIRLRGCINRFSHDVAQINLHITYRTRLSMFYLLPQGPLRQPHLWPHPWPHPGPHPWPSSCIEQLTRRIKHTKVNHCVTCRVPIYNSMSANPSVCQKK